MIRRAVDAQGGAADNGRMAAHILADGAMLLHGRALAFADEAAALLEAIEAAAPPRRMQTPGGFRMSVLMTSCGRAGWITDRRGYRYSETDPQSGRPWPEMPGAFAAFARDAAAEAGFPGFEPDSCLVNTYLPGARMSLHQDRDERDLSQPVVSVSLGLPATFLWGGLARSDRPQRLPLRHGDVVVWGGPSRLAFHGIAPLRETLPDTRFGARRINLTFRRAF